MLGRLFKIMFHGKDETDEIGIANSLEIEAKVRDIKRRIRQFEQEHIPSRRRNVREEPKVEKQIRHVGSRDGKQNKINDMRKKLRGY